MAGHWIAAIGQENLYYLSIIDMSLAKWSLTGHWITTTGWENMWVFLLGRICGHFYYTSMTYMPLVKCRCQGIESQLQDRGIYGYLYHISMRDMSLAKCPMAAQIAKFMGPTWGPPGSCGPQVAPWTLLSGREGIESQPQSRGLWARQRKRWTGGKVSLLAILT